MLTMEKEISDLRNAAPIASVQGEVNSEEEVTYYKNCLRMKDDIHNDLIKEFIKLREHYTSNNTMIVGPSGNDLLDI